MFYLDFFRGAQCRTTFMSAFFNTVRECRSAALWIHHCLIDGRFVFAVYCEQLLDWVFIISRSVRDCGKLKQFSKVMHFEHVYKSQTFCFVKFALKFYEIKERRHRHLY